MQCESRCAPASARRSDDVTGTLPATLILMIWLSLTNQRGWPVSLLSIALVLIVAVLSSPVEASDAGESATSVAPTRDAGQAAEWGALELQSRTIAPGTKSKFTFALERSVEGSFLDAALWAARGSSPGPTFCVVSGIHGDEINSVEIARRSFHGVDPQRLKGTLVVLPAVNSMGLRTMNRYMLDRRDLNRAFPGSLRGSVASIIANVVFESVVKRSDYLIDLHTGSIFRANVAQIRVDMDHPESLALAEGFAVGVMVGGAGPSGSLRREVVRAGVAAIIYESGPPYSFVPKEIENGTRVKRRPACAAGCFKGWMSATWAG